MGAERLEDAYAAVGVAEGHVVLAEDAQLDGVAVGFGQVLGTEDGHPESPQQLAHRRARAYPA